MDDIVVPLNHSAPVLYYSEATVKELRERVALLEGLLGRARSHVSHSVRIGRGMRSSLSSKLLVDIDLALIDAALSRSDQDTSDD